MSTISVVLQAAEQQFDDPIFRLEAERFVTNFERSGPIELLPETRSMLRQAQPLVTGLDVETIEWMANVAENWDSQSDVHKYVYITGMDAIANVVAEILMRQAMQRSTGNGDLPGLYL